MPVQFHKKVPAKFHRKVPANSLPGLVGRIREGDKKASTKMWNLQRAKIRNARRRTGFHETEIAESMWKNIMGGIRKPSLAASVSLALQRIRRRKLMKKKKKRTSAEIYANTKRATLTPFEETARNDARKEIEKLLKQYYNRAGAEKKHANRNIEIFESYYFKGETEEEIAHKVGVSISRVGEILIQSIEGLQGNKNFQRLVQEMAGVE